MEIRNKQWLKCTLLGISMEMIKIALLPGYIETYQRPYTIGEEEWQESIDRLNACRIRLFACLGIAGISKLMVPQYLEQDVPYYKRGFARLSWQFPLAAAAISAHFLYTEIRDLMDVLHERND